MYIGLNLEAAIAERSALVAQKLDSQLTKVDTVGLKLEKANGDSPAKAALNLASAMNLD